MDWNALLSAPRVKFRNKADQLRDTLDMDFSYERKTSGAWVAVLDPSVYVLRHKAYEYGDNWKPDEYWLYGIGAPQRITWCIEGLGLQRVKR